MMAEWQSWRRSAMMVGLVVAAALCLPAAPRAAEPAGEPVTLRIGEIGDPLALIAAIDKGYFAAQGVKITLVPLSGGPALISATIGGSTEMNYGDIFSWVAAVDHGFKVKLVQASNRGDLSPDPSGGWNSLLVRADGPIKSAQDLVGKRVGIAPTQLTQLQVMLWLAHREVDPFAVTFVPVTPYLSMGAALQGGHIDAILDADPFTQRDKKQYGFVSLGVPSREKIPNATTAAFYGREDWLAAHPDVVRRFVIAERQGAEWADSASQEDKADVVARFSPLDLRKLAAEVPGIVQDFHYYEFDRGAIDVAATQAWVDLAVKYKLLDRSVDISAHLYPTATDPNVH